MFFDFYSFLIFQKKDANSRMIFVIFDDNRISHVIQL